jgi:hypothetical protein
MTTEELIALAQRYHPHPGPASRYRDDLDYARALREAPETLARDEIRAQAMERETSWIDLVLHLRSHCPPGWKAWGNTIWRHDHAYGAVVFRVESNLMISVKAFESIFAPVYLLVEHRVVRDADGDRTLVELDEPVEHTADAWALVRVALEQRGVERIDPAVARMRVPGIVSTSGGFDPGEMTLAEALFTVRLRDC